MSKFKFSVALLVMGCAGAVDPKSNGDQTSTLEQKVNAADARARGAAQGDPCATHGWYGDGVCDTFCAHEDTDCVPKPEQGAPIVCAQFIEGKNGVCGRAENDPCRFQDPDCNAPPRDPGSGSGTVCAAIIENPDGRCSRPASDPCRAQDPDCTNPGAGGSGGSGAGGASSAGAPATSGGSTGTVCTAISEVPDGVCRRPADDPCRFQDPDCIPGAGGSSGGAGSGGTTGGGVDCDTSKVTCQTFAPVTCPDGKVPSVVNRCYGECVDKASCNSVSPVDPGGGSGGSTGGAAGVDCDVTKITCKTLAAVTCPEGQVPSVVNQCYGACVDKASCAPDNFDCLPEHAKGQTPPACPKGQVPRIVNGKYDVCVDKASCEPMACLAFIETSDGECKRLYNDPCRGQDPDCSAY